MTVITSKMNVGPLCPIAPANDNPSGAGLWSWATPGSAVPAVAGGCSLDVGLVAGASCCLEALSRPGALAKAPLTIMRRDTAGGGSGGDPFRRSLRIAVGIATVGRPLVARETIDRLSRQSRRPDLIAISVPSCADLAGEPEGHADLRILVGARGLTAQRNAILDAVPDADILCYFDDDFVAHADYLRAVEAAFLADPSLVGATGLVLADGITGPGYSAADADRFLGSPRGTVLSGAVPIYSTYGCNMAFRLDKIRAERLRFDERLPAYGWLEDVDFSRRVARFGGLARINGAVGVHLGVKGGRQSGRRFGYSQVANPIYLVGKGSYDWHRAAWLMSRNVVMNLIHAARPEPHIDRRGRLAGNVEAFVDLFRGRLNPARIAAFT